MPDTDLDESALERATRDLGSPVAATRDAAERALLKAKERAIPPLVRALSAPAEPGFAPPIGRVALILGAMRAREALEALYERALDVFAPAEAKPFIARAIAEIVDGRDAFDDRAREVLEALAGSDDRFVRAFAAQAFGALGDLRSKSRVEALAADEDAWVREQAEKVLRKIAEAEVAEGAPSLDDFAALAEAAAAEGGRLKPWLCDLGDARRAVREAAVAQLVLAGREAVPFLIDTLNQPETLPRIGAAQALGRIQATEAAGPLLIAATAPATTSLEKELVPVALRALANCLTGAEEGLAQAVLPLARHHDRFVRAAALLCLGRMPDKDAIRAVVTALTDPDPFVVESAAIALSEGVREEDTDLVLPLLDAFDKSGPRAAPALREAILIALSRIAIEAPAVRVRIRHRVRREVPGPTASTRKAAIALLERLYDEDDPPVLPLLDDVIVRLRDDHPEVRVVAAAFLARHLEPGFTQAARFLCDAIDRRERTLSLLCMEALRRHDTPTGRAALEALTADEDPEVAKRAKELLEGFEPQHEEWRFTPKTRKEPERLARTESQRPKEPEPTAPRRVRAVSDGGEGAVVEARFEGKEGPKDDEGNEGEQTPEPGEERGSSPSEPV